MSTFVFLTGLENGDSRVLKLLHGTQLPNARGLPRVEDLIGETTWTSRDDTLAKIMKGAANVLLCGDTVFMRGGDPIFVCDNKNGLKQYLIKVVDPTRRPLAFGEKNGLKPAGYLDWDSLVYCALEGAVFRADEIERAEAFALRRGIPSVLIDVVEIVSREMIPTHPAELQVTAAVHRLALGLRHVKDVSGNTALAAIVSRLVELTGRNNMATDSGVSVLMDFITWCEREKAFSKMELRHLYENTKRAGDLIEIEFVRRGLTFPCPLNIDDERALAELVT